MTTSDWPDWMTTAQQELSGFAGLSTQIAALIATGNPSGAPGGVPLLGAPALLYNYSVTAPANTGTTGILTQNGGAAVVNMGNYLSYDIDVVVQCNAAEPSPFVLWHFDWCLDAAGTVVAYSEAWGQPCSAAGQRMFGNGPVRAQYLKVSVGTTGSTNSFNINNFQLMATSRPYVGDNPDFRTNAPTALPGFASNGLGANIGDGVLGGVTGAANNLPANSTTLYCSGLYAGGVNVNILPPVALANVTYTPMIWLPGIGLVQISGSTAITNAAFFAFTQTMRYAFISRFVSTNGAAQSVNFNVITGIRA